MLHLVEYKYWAFISYSHCDAKVAAALQRAIENYRIPRRLVGRRSRLGVLPAYLKPVFRDRNELPAGADLDATVRDAVSSSRYLIVVCSPDAARSEWVRREIIEFKNAHGEGRVLALIASGEPFASRIPTREREECFPEALRFSLSPRGEPSGEPLDPVAADLRPEGDGKRLATLKILAGMMGVGVDELVRRDAQRRARRMALVAGASVAGMAVMAVLTFVAFRERAEAQRQHAQAEELIGFMLGDLRKKLDPIGHLELLDAVGANALAYYAKQDASRLDADSLGRRSRALHLIGEIREQRGKLDEALAAFTSAAVTTEQALSQSPNDGQRVFDHAQSVYWVGYIALLRGQTDAAQAAFLQYRELADRLVRIDPANPDWRLETAYASQNLGVVELDREHLAEALRSFSRARDAYAALLAVKPELALELADAHGWVAEVHESLGDYESAISAQKARLNLLGSLSDAASNARARRNTANAHFAIAQLELFQGDVTAAEGDARASAEMAAALASTDTTNFDWLSELCFNRLRLAEVDLALARPDAARGLLEQVKVDAARLEASDASMLLWQVGIDGFVLALESQMAIGDRHDPSVELIDAFVEKVGRLEASNKKLGAHETEIVATLELTAGDFRARQGQYDAARARWTEAASRLQPRAASNAFSAVTLLARLRLRLGETAEARALAARVEASKFRHPAYSGLLKELSHVPPTNRPKPASSDSR